jgi:hypothetical protein
VSLEISLYQAFKVLNCAQCAVPFGVPERLESDRRADGKPFFCPHGHPNVFSAIRDVKVLQRQIDQERERRLLAESDKEKLLLEMKRIGERISNGVCPCCNRTFKDLKSHMRTKHSVVKQIA